MKKIFTFISLLTVLFLFACTSEEIIGDVSKTDKDIGNVGDNSIIKDKYTLTVEGYDDLLFEPLEKFYKAGQRILVKTHIVLDGIAVAKLNGENPISKRLVSDENGRYLYYENEFAMPAKNSVLSLTVSGGMLAPLEYSLTVNDKYQDLFEQPNKFYSAGEKVIVKTSLICDAEVVVELNGAKPLSRQLVKDEEGYYIYEEWEFIMPSKDSLLNVFSRPGMDAIYYDVEVVDNDGLVINQLSGMYAHGEIFEIHSMHSDLEITVNGVILSVAPEAVLNGNGEVLYYSWSGFEITSDITIAVIVQSSAE